MGVKLELTPTLMFIRRMAAAIAEGAVDAKKVAGMTDDELIAFDNGTWTALVEAQAEAQELADQDKAK